jgi:hypothetical protein
VHEAWPCEEFVGPAGMLSDGWPADPLLICSVSCSQALSCIISLHKIKRIGWSRDVHKMASDRCLY